MDDTGFQGGTEWLWVGSDKFCSINTCGRQNIMSTCQFPEAVNTWQKEFADVMRLRILKPESTLDYPSESSVLIRVLIKESGRREGQCQSDIMWERLSHCWLWRWGGGHGPRNAVASGARKGKGVESPHRISRRNTHCQHPGFSPVKFIWDFFFSTERGSCFIAQAAVLLHQLLR